MQLWLARPISQAMLATKQFRPLDAHKGEDLAFEPLRHILTGKDMLLYHACQFIRVGRECPTSSATPSRCASRGRCRCTKVRAVYSQSPRKTGLELQSALARA